MFYTFAFVAFERNHIERNMFQTLVFLNWKISLTSKMFYFSDPRVFIALYVSFFNIYLLPVSVVLIFKSISFIGDLGSSRFGKSEISFGF